MYQWSKVKSHHWCANGERIMFLCRLLAGNNNKSVSAAGLNLHLTRFIGRLLKDQIFIYKRDDGAFRPLRGWRESLTAATFYLIIVQQIHHWSSAVRTKGQSFFWYTWKTLVSPVSPGQHTSSSCSCNIHTTEWKKSDQCEPLSYWGLRRQQWCRRPHRRSMTDHVGNTHRHTESAIVLFNMDAEWTSVGMRCRGM